MSSNEELTESLHRIDVVGHASRFPAAVHSEDGITHVNASERD